MIKLSPNQLVVDWDFNTGYMTLQISLGDHNLRDADKPDYGTMSDKEIEWRKQYEELRQAILEKFS